MTELSAGEKLYSFHTPAENFIDNSFDPIISYGIRAAMTVILQHQRQILPLSPVISFWQIQADTITKVLQIPPVQLLSAI